MRRFTFRMLPFALVLCTLIVPAALAADGDEAAIRKVHADFTAAWNRHDPAALAAIWSDNGDLVNPEGRWAKGKAEVQKNFAGEQGGIFKSSTFTNIVTGVRFLAPNIAVVDASFEIQNATPPNAPPMTQKGLYKAVMVKEGGTWRTASAMAMAPVAPPPAAPAHH
ncbi:MAG: SgcJ/EcaC family oxidoreductase [Thermoanaerobaculia bacterium]|nr:SgcJ/EcaC family oxidoreductase [Thermoanaerobaculia bacterium]